MCVCVYFVFCNSTTTSTLLTIEIMIKKAIKISKSK